jgi:hypothetical protein
VRVIAGPGETTVTHTDEVADPGMLKIWLAPTTNPSAGVGFRVTLPLMVAAKYAGLPQEPARRS